MQINPKSGTKHGSFHADTIEIITDRGRFWIGEDNDGNTYVSSYVSPISITPSASNRILIKSER